MKYLRIKESSFVPPSLQIQKQFESEKARRPNSECFLSHGRSWAVWTGVQHFFGNYLLDFWAHNLSRRLEVCQPYA